jgi:hypothetical protein
VPAPPKYTTTQKSRSQTTFTNPHKTAHFFIIIIKKTSTSIWYVLAFIESHRGVRRGDKVWQLGFGSGFKCNSAVWVARKRIRYAHPAWEGFDLQAMRDEMDAAEREKAAYLAAKAAAAAKAGGGK